MVLEAEEDNQEATQEDTQGAVPEAEDTQEAVPKPEKYIQEVVPEAEEEDTKEVDPEVEKDNQ